MRADLRLRPIFLQVLDWTGRQLRRSKLCSIAANAPPILERLQPSEELWLHAVEQFGRRRAANRLTRAMLKDYSRLQRWEQSLGGNAQVESPLVLIKWVTGYHL